MLITSYKLKSYVSMYNASGLNIKKRIIVMKSKLKLVEYDVKEEILNTDAMTLINEKGLASSQNSEDSSEKA